MTGSFTVTVTANDAHGHTTPTNFTLTVAPANVAPVVVTPIPNQSATQGTNWNYTVPAGTFSDANGDPLTYSASGYPSGVNFNPASRVFSGAPSVTV